MKEFATVWHGIRYAYSRMQKILTRERNLDGEVICIF